MNTFVAHLRKEALAQRATAVTLVALLVVAAVALAVLLPESTVLDGGYASRLGFGALLLAIAVFGSELVAGETSRTTQLLARLPRGLPQAWCAKLAFFAAALLFFPVVTWCAALLARSPTSGSPPFLGVQLVLASEAWQWLCDASVLAVWTFALSSWVPRGLLALPAALLLGGGLVALCSPWREWGAYGLLRSLWPLQLAAGLGVGYLSFARGRRFGGGPGRAAAWGSAVLVPVLAAHLGLVLLRVHEHSRFDPQRFHVTSAVLSADGRRVF